MLYFVPGDKFIDPLKVGNSDLIRTLERVAHFQSFKRLLQTYNEGSDWVVANGGKIVWTKTGALFGYNSPRPYKDVEHIWKIMEQVYGDSRLALMSAGTLLKWTIAKRPETWLCTSQPTGYIDSVTGKEIQSLSYWIDDNYSPPRKQKANVSDLTALFNTYQ